MGAGQVAELGVGLVGVGLSSAELFCLMGLGGRCGFDLKDIEGSGMVSFSFCHLLSTYCVPGIASGAGDIVVHLTSPTPMEVRETNSKCGE